MPAAGGETECHFIDYKLERLRVHYKGEAPASWQPAMRAYISGKGRVLRKPMSMDHDPHTAT